MAIDPFIVEVQPVTVASLLIPSYFLQTCNENN